MIKVINVADLGPLFTENDHQMVGQDGAYSIPTDKGLLFFFGDTIIGKRTPKVSLWYPDGKPIENRPMERFGEIIDMPVNCGLLFRSTNDFEYILNEEGKIRELVPSFPHETPDKWRVWCMHGIQIGKKLYLSYIKVKMLEEGMAPVNFEIHGSGIAVGDTDTWKFTRILDNGHRSIWTADQPMFSSAILDGNDGWIYLYGVRNESGNQKCYLSRVKPDDIEQPEKYRYWDGSGWNRDIRSVQPVMFDMPNEMSVSWNIYLGCWLAVYSEGTGGRIVACTSQRPEGPWSNPVLLHTVEMPEHDLPYPRLIYAAKEHPVLSKNNGSILWITYIEFEEYFPHLLEIKIEKSTT
ncbi:MAG: DUF4185 domain-containing protein [Balneolaceae bacterium]|nr:MAG: DUF4185 domain-containing protein [Balneolaceae bacterium]